MIRILLSIATGAAALCPYADMPGNTLVADATCGNTIKICGVNSSCAVTNSRINYTIPTYTGWPSVGDMAYYTLDTLTIKDSPTLDIHLMKLPKIIEMMTFDTIGQMDLTKTKTTSWDYVKTLQFLNSPSVPFPNGINWPPVLDILVIKNNSVSNIPQGLPKTLTQLAIQGNTLLDLNYLPAGLSLLNLDSNSLSAISNQDWTTLTFLRLSYNEQLVSISNVKLSSNLTYFDIGNCSMLTNITMDSATFAAIDRLSPWAGNEDKMVGYVATQDVLTNAGACTALGGSLQQLWKQTTKRTINVCVTSTESKDKTTTPTPSSSNTGMIVGIACGAVAVVAIIAFFIIRNRKKPEPPMPYIRYEPPPVTYTNYSNGTGMPTQGTGGSAGTGGNRGSLVYADADVVLDVKPLLHHRLELADLHITSNKPLASGAYGEVWLGAYGGQQVAVKRMKKREARAVQSFIDEIVLMSQMDSDYIVKFVGASWTRPIEIECVVEYMDLGDLRSFLVAHPPSVFTWEQKYHCIVSIVRGLVYLHTFKPPIIHRDLKSRNVLLDSVKGTKLTDFGASRVAEEDDLMTNGIGTYQWMAPEVIAGTSYGAAADIYSFGIILSEFCTHQVPYADLRHPESGRPLQQHYVQSEVRLGRLHPTFAGEGVPSWVADIGMKCLTLNEEDRPTALQLSVMLNRCRPL
ncbi:protein kinase [Achlya hypogyna]|uniref:Protein kinase n=1 Tax=Achlya hypogyna TaxID=1202772 RepID=A0A1V9Y4J0_ACHHY|nr:protein kinase [Achlya hypogyna]